MKINYDRNWLPTKQSTQCRCSCRENDDKYVLIVLVQTGGQASQSEKYEIISFAYISLRPIPNSDRWQRKSKNQFRSRLFNELFERFWMRLTYAMDPFSKIWCDTPSNVKRQHRDISFAAEILDAIISYGFSTFYFFASPNFQYSLCFSTVVCVFGILNAPAERT